MKILNSANIVFPTALLFGLMGCSGQSPESVVSEPTGSAPAAVTAGTGQTAPLDTEEESLLSDDLDATTLDDAEEDLDVGIEQDSGGSVQGTNAQQTASQDDDDADADEDDQSASAPNAASPLVLTNRGRFFTPAGCLTSTRIARGEWSHVFQSCKGPRDRFTYTGTITSKRSFANGVRTIQRDAADFVIAGARLTATVTGTKVIEISRAAGVLTRHRVGDFAGTVMRNAGTRELPFYHESDFTTTWTRASREYTRDGSASTRIGNRAISRTVTGYKATGSRKACPSQGTIVVQRKGGARNLTIVLGGNEMTITGSGGRTVSRPLTCGSGS